MIDKNVQWLLIILLISRAECSFSQSQWTYDFNNGLNPIEIGGPALKPLGQPGQYIKEKIPGSDYLNRTIYQFEKNSGLQFNNAEAKGFLNKSFTIEIYFKLTELDSWKRVLDFKNRKSDYGSYIYDGKLNFYDYAIGEKAPVRANQYVHYVYSRDFETKNIKMYINGQSKLEFKDPGTEGMLDNDQVLNFFQDDLIANHESSAGSIVLVRLYDRVMTPVFIRRSYQTISKVAKETVAQEEEEPVKETLPDEKPARNKNLTLVTGRVYDGGSLKPVHEAEVLVRKSANDSLVAQTKTVEGVFNFELAPYESYRISAQVEGFQSKSVNIRTTNRFEEVKSLISLSPETYALPLSTLYFQQGNETLEDGSFQRLDSTIAYFQKRPDLKIVLKGHTDNTGSFEKNLELSNKRVSTIKTYLTGKGIAETRIEGTGFGSAQPNKMNQTEIQKKSNRRVEIWAEPIKR
ncbi:OmpA family protein [Dyadobacter arcticus]|uniref:Outer membrane protein OmpA-like peptidoglycan-associated protein n=1 Tax=Dyadobacter arcticus TaxID=1078754 RepID=A0ABX0UJS2_9BACT|nr:OmpA family protein [Dyadobacter arcticus]NIJ53254.1 outer membrane protein OmpA-like peptidoglycan-associated protein [Dyadobacter arcticus]